MKQDKQISRRTLLAVSAGVLAPLVLPSGVVGALGRPGANSRVRVALIGCGRRGAEILSHLGSRVVAVCDVDKRRFEAVADMAGRARRYADYRRVLEDRDLDGVIIATPDHWHAVQACHAMEAGKDVYLETPVCLSLGDAARLVSTADDCGAVVYTGKEAHWSRGAPQALDTNKQFPDSGVTRISCWGSDNRRGGDAGFTGAVPDGLNWDRWLGPAPWQRYNPALLDGNARFLLALGGGELASQGSQVFYAVLDALKMERLGVVRVTARGTPPLVGLYDAPQTMRVEYDWVGQQVAMVWQQRKMAAEDCRYGARLRSDGKVTALTPVLSGDRPEATARRRPLAESLRYWLDAMVLRPDTGFDLRRAASAAVLAALGNIAYRTGRPVTWDSARGKFLNDPAADRLIAPPTRAV